MKTTDHTAFGGYPLGHQKTTELLDRLVADTDDFKRRQAINEDCYVRYLRRLWQEEAAAEGANR